MAMADITALMGLLQTFAAANDTLKALVGMRVTAGVQAKIIELNNLILTAQSQALVAQSENAALLARIGHLEKEIVDAKGKSASFEGYHLTQVSPGAFAYAIEADRERAEPAHWLCQTCYSDGHRSILQLDSTFSIGRHDLFVCPRCDADMEVEKGVRPS